MTSPAVWEAYADRVEHANQATWEELRKWLGEIVESGYPATGTAIQRATSIDHLSDDLVLAVREWFEDNKHELTAAGMIDAGEFQAWLDDAPTANR